LTNKSKLTNCLQQISRNRAATQKDLLQTHSFQNSSYS